MILLSELANSYEAKCQNKMFFGCRQKRRRRAQYYVQLSFWWRIVPIDIFIELWKFQKSGDTGDLSNENIIKGSKAGLTHECFFSTSSTDIKVSSKV